MRTIGPGSGVRFHRSSESVAQLTILLVHATNFASVATEQNDIVVKLGDICSCRQLGSRNMAQWVQRRDVVESFEKLVHQPDGAEAQDIVCREVRRRYV